MINDSILKRVVLKLFLFIIEVNFAMLGVSSSKMNTDELKALKEVTTGINSFAFQLYQALSAENPNTNVFTSPLSLQIVMALAYSGARGKTAEEIATVLKLPKNEKIVLDGYHAVINAIKNPVLNLATKMFLEKSFNLKEQFNQNAKRYFESEAEMLNFKSDSSGSQNIINRWVEKKTNDKIKDLIGDGVLTSDTVMVLVNAIHFKADWKTPFSTAKTHPENFYINENEPVEVQMMHLSEDFRYAENTNLDAKILELPYEGNQFSMYIILPNKINGLAALEEAIGKKDLSNLLTDLDSIKVDVSLPKFEISQTIDLNNVLKTLGMQTIFDIDAADFSGISDEPIAVSKVVQKTFIQVDEKGTEAAAATGLMVSNRAFTIREKFTANHPFLFLILKNDSIIFIGKFNARK